MAYLDGSTFVWALAIVQIAGLVSAPLARLSEGSRGQVPCHWLFLGCLAAIGLATMLAVHLGPRLIAVLLSDHVDHGARGSVGFSPPSPRQPRVSKCVTCRRKSACDRACTASRHSEWLAQPGLSRPNFSQKPSQPEKSSFPARPATDTYSQAQRHIPVLAGPRLRHAPNIERRSKLGDKANRV